MSAACSRGPQISGLGNGQDARFYGAGAVLNVPLHEGSLNGNLTNISRLMGGLGDPPHSKNTQGAVSLSLSGAGRRQGLARRRML